MADSIEKRFGSAMENIYFRAKEETGYQASRYLQMVHERGGIETARFLLAQPGVSDGFAVLWEKQRLDLTVEALVLEPEWQGLFTEGEKAIAKRRLGK
ncbi:hypothetical protein TRP8649_02081 [Pelagimonas phthalicica]|uniref:Uncharacterized protein n=1 Tax=Pelagimonas phthalicica TaxID=1037362 RepID=A0A238JBJ4_9RHOB|nr:hypothetical protein [Pelagimonas phthalicica]TDS90922.1 hypothetical protein CLV87_2083 [Pelagimonas phthalicica]SMX27969.1 hypothetical protein TRP8649_02081 [Pelagimonas phthalicica]